MSSDSSTPSEESISEVIKSSKPVAITVTIISLSIFGSTTAPNIMWASPSILPIHTIYDSGFTTVFGLPFKLRSEGGDYILLTIGFIGLYIGIGRSTTYKVFGGYSDGVVFYAGAFLYTKIKGII